MQKIMYESGKWDIVFKRESPQDIVEIISDFFSIDEINRNALAYELALIFCEISLEILRCTPEKYSLKGLVDFIGIMTLNKDTLQEWILLAKEKMTTDNEIRIKLVLFFLEQNDKRQYDFLSFIKKMIYKPYFNINTDIEVMESSVSPGIN
ncbi:MAG: hypothetical protein H6Q70_2414 [Firmicutes bacterium]|nr:hypothetical protein [Bacillota bacterium]